MTTEATDTTGATLLPFGELNAFSSLYTDYCSAFDRVAPFFARRWSSAEDRAAAVDAAAAAPRDREALVTVLREQQPLWGDDPSALQALERLMDPSSAAVVTGQQVGLFTGPMYTVLKAMTTVVLARQLENETGRPVVPVFWLGSEDHDFDEMAVTGIPSGSGVEELHYVGHELPETGNLGPVGALELDSSISDLIDRLEELLPPTEFRDDVVGAVRDAYAPGTTFRDAFGRLLRRILPGLGLVYIAVDHPVLKRLALPLFRKEIVDGTTLVDRIRATNRELDERYHVQVQVSPTNLFVLHDGSRLPIDLEGGTYRVRGTDQTWTQAQLLALLEAEPGRFSPNVVLRPLTQDTLLPTAAYVAGPGEIAYFAQYRQSYEWAGLPMPVIYPRASVTHIERHVRRSLGRLDRDIPAFGGDVEALFSELVLEQLGYDLERRFREASAHLHEAVNGLKETVSSVDSNLARTVESTRSSLLKEMDRLRERVMRSERRRQDDLRGHVDKVAGAIFPGGAMQERRVSPLWFLNKYGPDLFVRMLDRLDIQTGQHLVVDL